MRWALKYGLSGAVLAAAAFFACGMTIAVLTRPLGMGPREAFWAAINGIYSAEGVVALAVAFLVGATIGLASGGCLHWWRSRSSRCYPAREA